MNNRKSRQQQNARLAERSRDAGQVLDPTPVPERGGSLQLVAASFEGPLPPPDLLASYDRALPGLPERIVAAWEGETNHRRQVQLRALAMDEKLVDSEVWSRKAGIVAGFTIAAGGIVAAVVLVVLNAPIAAAVVGGLPLAAIVGAFIYGTHRRSKQKPPED